MPRTLIRARYGERTDDHLRALFEQAGLDFNPPGVMPNSRTALRVTELARDRGLHARVHDRLMEAVWSEGKPIGDADVLRELAVESGLDENEVVEVISGDAYLDRVEGSTAHAHEIGVTGVPAFVLDRRLLVLGAQPREVFEQAFAQLGARALDA
jgi:predicted DsbA family dithiol-disulfide isomerase